MLALPLLAAPLAAQKPDSTRRDTAVVIAPIEVVGSIVPTAGPTVGSGVPAHVSTVTGRQIDAWEPRLLVDALTSQTGLSSYDDYGSPYKLNLSFRGFNVGPVVGLPPGISVFLDGVRQNEPDAAEVNFDLLPMEHVKRIELVSGTGSLLGPNSLGGAVNLISQRGSGPTKAELELSGGSYASYSTEASVSGLNRTGWDYYLGGGYENEGGWRKATGAENYNGFLNLGHLGGLRGISFQVMAAKSRASAAGSLPESLFDVNPRDNFTVGDFDDLRLLQFSSTGYAPLGGGRGSFTAYYRNSHAERFNVNQAPDNNVRSFTENGTLGGNGDWRWSRPLGSAALSLRLGADGAANQVHVQLNEENPRNPADRTLTTDVKSPSWDVAGYSLADLRRGRVTLSGGFRYDYIRIPFQNQLDPATDTTSSFHRLNPRGGVSVDLGPGNSVYASAGQSFRAPAILELACADPAASCPLPFALGDDPPLKPVIATNYEVGGQWLAGLALFTGSIYRTDVRDDISFIQSDSALFRGFFANIGRTRREGIELGVHLSIGGDASLYANYAYTHATFRTPATIFSVRSDTAFAGSPLAGPNAVAVGDRIPLVPAHQVKAGALFGVGRHVQLGIDARYTGKQWLRGDEANETKPLNGYFSANLRAGVSLGPWEVNGILTNAFDSHRAIFGTFNQNRSTGQLERFLTPLNARSFKLVLRREFGGGPEQP